MAFTISVRTKELMTLSKMWNASGADSKKTALGTEAFITAVAMKIHFIF